MTNFRSTTFKGVLLAVGAIVALLLVFKAGVLVGYSKARFSYRWGENYHQNFAGPRGGFFGDFKRGFRDRDFINAHGTVGSVISISGNTLVVKGRDDVEKVVLVSDGTAILKGRETIRLSDLQPDDRVVIIGSPNDQGQIDAKVIRMFDKQPL